MNYTTEMMRNLMMDLLDLAQMEKNTFKLNKTYFDMFKVIDKAFNLVQHISSKKKVTLVAPEVDIELKPYYANIYGD